METTGTKDPRNDQQAWTEERLALWRRMEAHPFEPEEQVLPFVRRLARDKDWSIEYARGAVEEYRRFCFLAVTSRTPMTPSEEVDEVWHQHLTYTRDYWDRWCGQALGRTLHHDPTAGGPVEGARFREQYAETLARYEAFFGPPDARYWPAARVRFGTVPRFRTVDRARVFVLPRLPGVRALLGRGAAALGLAVAQLSVAAGPARAAELPANPLDWPAEPFLLLYVAVAVAALLGAVLLRRNPPGPRPAGPAESLGTLQLAYLSGGAARVADTVVVGMLAAGAAELDAKGSRVQATNGAARLPAELDAFRGVLSEPVTRKQVKEWTGLRIADIRERLAALGLAPGYRHLRRLAWLTLFLVVPVVLLGLAKVSVGLGRGKPVGFLVLLLAATGLAGIWLLLAQPYSTRAGRRALAEHTERLSRVIRAPREGELSLAFALAGTAVLLGTPYEAFRSFVTPSSGGGDGGGCGGGGDGGGGGGCGGCGS